MNYAVPEKRDFPVAYPVLTLILMLPILALAGPVITVGDVDGGDQDCDYSYQQLSLAINEVQAMGSGEPVDIHLAVPNGFGSLEMSIDDLSRDVRFFGGFESCGSETAGWDYTEIRLPASPGNRLFHIDLSGATEARVVTFERVTLNGQQNDNQIDTGGLVRAEGAVEVVFRDSEVINGLLSGINGGLIAGGGLYLGDGAKLTTTRRARFSGNFADVGGAIYCGEGAEVELGSGEIVDNSAGFGGALALDEGCLGLQFTELPTASFPRHRIRDNQANVGGAIYSVGVDITTSAPESLARRHIAMSGNSAVAGGAIAMVGDPDNPAVLELANTALVNNSAGEVGGALFLSGGVRARLAQTSDPRFPCVGVPAVTCLEFRNNGADAATDPHGGGFAFLDDGVNGLPELIIERAHIRHNYSPAAAAVVHVGDEASLVIHNSVVSETAGNFLFTAASDAELVLMYNTITDMTDIDGIHATGAVHATLTGSIYWNGSHPLWTNPDQLATLEHGDCLLSSTVANLPNPGAVITDDPHLTSLMVPTATSPAINICDGRHQDRLPPGAMNIDFKFDPRGTNSFGGPTLFGPYDLGAAAFLDAVFNDRFE